MVHSTLVFKAQNFHPKRDPMNNLLSSTVIAFSICVATPTAIAGGDASRGISLLNNGSFNYQGHLEFEGQPANGDFFFEVHLLDSNGDEIDPLFDQPGPITVTNGLFDMDIQMGGTQVDSEYFWRKYGHLIKSMRIMVGQVEGGTYTTLSPDVDLGSTPHALWSRYSSALQFPYTDTYANDFAEPVTMLSLTNQFGGTVLEAIAGLDNSSAIISVQSPTPNGLNFGTQTGGVHIDAEGRPIGLISVADQYAFAGILLTNSGIQNSAILGQVNSGVTSANAFLALNFDSGNNVALGTPDYAGDFSGDIIARNDLRVRGEPTRDFMSNSPSPIGPLAYGSVSAGGIVTSGTANFSAQWNAVSEYYEVTIADEFLGFATHSITVTVVDIAEPRVATFNTFGGIVAVKIWDLNSGNIAVQDNFSIVIHDSNPTTINRITVPTGVDEDKYTEQTGATLIETKPRNEPVESFEHYGSGVQSN